MTLLLGGIQISDISLLNPHVRTPLGRPEFYVKVECDANRRRKTAKKHLQGDRVCWTESFSFDTGDIARDSLLTFTVIRTHFLVTERIGLFKQKVADLIQSRDNTGSCTLDVTANCRLIFSIKETTDILPAVSVEISESILPAPINITWSSFLSQFEIFLGVLGKISEINPYTNLAWSILSLVPETILSLNDRNENIQKLCEKLRDVYNYITDAKRLPELAATQSKALTVLVRQTIECAYFIQEYGTRSIAGNTWSGSSIDDKIGAFNEKLDHILNVLINSITLENSIVTLRVFKLASETKDLSLLNEMPYERDAGFVSGKKCLPGTRQSLINEIIEWVNSDTSERILILSGQAGTGKSAVAHTIAEIFQNQNRLGSLFCFDRSYKNRCNFLFSTISRNLADGDTSWRKKLVETIENTAVKTSTDPVTQFNELIVKPSKEVGTIGPVVIIIDALDESGDREERETILELLLGNSSELPNNYRIIITSRPEQDIESLCDNSTTVRCKRLEDIAREETLSDIKYYISNRLKRIAQTLDTIDGDWCNVLAERAEGLFQWAETACRFIGPTLRHPPLIEKRWRTCISRPSTSLNDLYGLYSRVISRLPESDDVEFLYHFKSVVGAILVAREPLSINTLQNIFQNVVPSIQTILCPFGSLFIGVYDSFVPIRPLHTSLFDFFNYRGTGSDDNQYYIDTSDHSLLTLGCVNLMNRMLRFNICNLETSHLRNRDVPDFQARVEGAIPVHLSYACRFWALHLHSSNLDNDLMSELRVLMRVKLLYLIEVLSLLKEIERCCSAMIILKDWSENLDNDLAAQASDAWQFCRAFGEVMMISTPHLYLSALPFAPTDSFISKQYLPQYPRLFDIEIGQSIRSVVTETGIMKSDPSSSSTSTSFAFSPQGNYIASGFDNGEVWLWDYRTGEETNRCKHQLSSQEAGISDIVFSPNGETVYGCFIEAKCILIWNVKTNITERESYESIIKGSCRFFTISSNGYYIAFESYDGEVFIYDRKDRQMIICFDTIPGGTLTALARKHKKSVFSPDADLFVFVGRSDGVCVWNTGRQELVASWTEFPTCLALTDDYIAFFSEPSLEIWDVTTTKSVFSFRPQVDVSAIQISGDNHFVLSSYGYTCCIWSLPAGQLIRTFLFDDNILDFALSPDSECIALGVDDGKTYIRHWDRGVQSTDHQDSNLYGVLDFVISRIWLQGTCLILFIDSLVLQVSDVETASKIIFMDVVKEQSPVVVFSLENVVHVAYVSDDDNLCLWNKSEEQFTLDTPENHVTALAFSTTTSYLISGDDRGTVKIWDMHTLHLIGGPYNIKSRINILLFSPSGTNFLVSYGKLSGDRYFEVRDCLSGNTSVGPTRCAAIGVKSLGLDLEIVFSANGKHIACTARGGLQIFDAATGKEVGWVKLSKFSVESLSKNGKYLAWATNEENCQVQLWDIDNNTILEGFRSPHPVQYLFFSNDSTQVVAVTDNVDGNEYVNIWDVLTKESITIKTSYPGLYTLALDDKHLALAVVGHSNLTWTLQLRTLAATLSRFNENHDPAFPRSNPLESIINKAPSDTTNPVMTSAFDYALIAWNKALFSYSSEWKDGYILGPHGELLFWVPKERREGLWFPGVVHVATGAEKIIKLNFTNFVHGTQWRECKGVSNSSMFDVT